MTPVTPDDSAQASTPKAPVIREGDGPISLTISRGSTCEQASNRLTLSATDTNAEALSWQIKTKPQFGSAQFEGESGPDVVACYTPSAGQVRPDSFVVEVTNSDGLSDQITITIRAQNATTPPGRAPDIDGGALRVITVQASSSCSNSANQTVFVASDADSSIDSLVWSIETAPRHGIASFPGTTNPFLNGSTATVCYTPEPAQADSDSFVVVVKDPEGHSDNVTVGVLVSGGSSGSGGRIVVDPAAMDWGDVSVGQTGSNKPIQLTNTGDAPATISSMTFHVQAGAGHDFHVRAGGIDYSGDDDDVTIPTQIAIAPGQTVTALASFVPSELQHNDVMLELRGDFPGEDVHLMGSGVGTGGHPYLHVVIHVPAQTIDWDRNGTESVVLDGSDSHTHEVNHSLAGFEWTSDGAVIATTAIATTPFNTGQHTIGLTIRDDHTPPQMLTDYAPFQVIGPDVIPGALVRYYEPPQGNPASLLDNLPAKPNYAEPAPCMTVESQSGRIGQSPYAGGVLVRLVGQVQITGADAYAFQATGGNGRRLFVDGTAAGGAIQLGAGRHTIEARFAVNALAELPLNVTYARAAAPQASIACELLTHDETDLPPIINSMTPEGLQSGGNTVEILGMGFKTAAGLAVRWGAATIAANGLTVEPDRIRFTAPAGTGQIAVTVENANGASLPATYAYTTTGPAPISFTLSDVVTGVTNPTTIEWGPDGRLYVGCVTGTIYAYTLDDAYNIIATQAINTIAGLTNNQILGITFNPRDPPGNVRIYVAHAQLYANGGSCFTGSSPYSGQVSVLTGPNFSTVSPLMTSLPVSNHDHAINGMQFDNNGDLYVCIGGNTNAGVEGCNIGGLPESPLSACIIKAQTSKANFNGQIVYRETASGAVNYDQVFGGIVDVVPGVDVAPFVVGLRNPYDLVFTTMGRFYCTDNGPNPGFGAASMSATTQAPDPNDGDELNLIEQGMYYGHPNRNRGRTDDRQNVYRNRAAAGIAGVFSQTLANLSSSTDGIVEYRANTFNGAMRGDLIVQKWSSTTNRVTLSTDGRSVVGNQALPVALASLDVTTGPGGVLFGADYSGNKVVIAQPAPTPGLAVYDTFPWRAPASGGKPFLISGNGFGSLATTSVTIGGLPAQLTSVSATRIRGTIPARAAGASNLLDIVVTVSGQSRTLTGGFRYLGG